MNKFFLSALFSLVICSTLCGVDLVKNKKLMFDGIVTPDKPVPSVVHAARELYYHIKKATVRKLPIIKESAAKTGKRYIYVGGCKANSRFAPEKMAWNSGVIVIAKERIHIAGFDSRAPLYAQTSSTGTLFAAYEFLEKYLGVRWLWPGELGEHIPYRRTITLPEETHTFKPLLRTSCFRGGVIKRGRVAGWEKSENMENFLKAERLWLLRHRFSQDRRLIGGHAFTDYYNRYHKTNPDFFSMLPDGKRRLNPWKWSKKPSVVSLCASNPVLADTIVENWRKSGCAPPINVNENDTAGECICDNCLAADNSPLSAAQRRAAAKKQFLLQSGAWPYALGSVSDRYCKLFLAVQTRADRIKPGSSVAGLIYANYSEPPSEKIKLNERIILRFCPPAMYPWPQDKIDRYKRQWDGWAKSGASLIFRPNFAADGHYFPVQFHEVFYDLFTFAARRRMIGSDIDSCTGQYATQALPNYVIASLNHGVDTPLAKLEDEYYSAFGAAKEKIKAYTEYMKELSMKPGLKDPFIKDATLEGGKLFRFMILVADEVFTQEAVAKAEKMLADAANTPQLDAKSARRVRMLQYGIEHIKLAMAAQVEFRNYQKTGKADGFFKAVAKLDEFRKKVEPLLIMNMGHLRYLDNLAWRNIPNFKRIY